MYGPRMYGPSSDVWIAEIQKYGVSIHRNFDVWTLRWSLTCLFFRFPMHRRMATFIRSPFLLACHVVTS